MNNLDTILIAMAALAVSGMCVTGFVGWWVRDTVQTGTDELCESTDELRARLEKQSEGIATLSSALHHARLEVTRVHAQVGELRAELDAFVHGPPSLRGPGPPGPASHKQPEKSP